MFPDCRHYSLICHPELDTFLALRREIFFFIVMGIAGCATGAWWAACFPGLLQMPPKARSHSSVMELSRGYFNPALLIVAS
jgi:hypothetical protein